ncbi:uncharacterized protein zgc:113229 [Perca flavescens]|uniref:uncharacterized protein zgc:113229 n=1 Tax=Perca flavescens TaxID=8167 RepID=UPI00106E008D|nr:uncharacterized protein LOC114562271 [Perca flavescens]XP_028444389.1 uncharacterized protein LOC114562271 [Perca flavescens]
MSQSHNPKDNQALLQSMLQRLKLQPGKEGQAYLHTPVPTTTASTWWQDGKRGATNIQKVNSSPVNGFEFGSNGIPSKEFGISAADRNFGLKGGKIQQPGHGFEVDRGLISFPSQKDNIDGDTNEDRVLGQATQPGINLTGRGQLFPAESLKDADITSFERTDGVRVSLGSSAMTRHILSNKDAVTSMGQNQDQDLQVCKWSLKPTNVDTESQGNEVLHMENRGFGALAQSKDMQIVPTSSSSRRKQRSSENKTRRWTQKIKERWKDRPGSFGKKGKEEGGRVEQKSEQGTEISSEKQLLTAEHLINTPNKEEERTLPSLYSSDRSNAPPTYTEDANIEGKMRSSSDFEFGLGSFSLLEEIVTGQEWAKFINPNQSAYSANRRPSELKNPHDSGQSYLILNQQGGVNNQWSFRGTEPSPDLDFTMAQISPEAFQAVSMDVSEGKQAAARDVHSEANQSEPMEHGHTRRPPLFVKPENILDKLALKSRVHLNRKRQYQSAERRDEMLQTEEISHGKEAYREGSISSLSLTSNQVMEATGESQHDNLMPLYIRNSNPPPLSPSTLFAPAPRGVLKHSISQESQSSMGTVTKRRRVEVNRRVHFSEEVVAITPPELDPDATDSEDSGAEEDSVIEQECEQEEEEDEQAATKRVEAPTRRPALPAWILALKRWNTGKKDRQGL